jgi:hypothetical protein
MYAPPGELAPFAVARIDDSNDCPIHPVADFAFGEGPIARTDRNPSQGDGIAAPRESRRMDGAGDHGAR